MGKMKNAMLLLLILFTTIEAQKRLIVETSTQEQTAPPKGFAGRAFDSIDSILDIVADMVRNSLVQIEQRYDVKYPYNSVVCVLAVVLAIFFSSKILSLLSRPKVRYIATRG